MFGRQFIAASDGSEVALDGEEGEGSSRIASLKRATKYVNNDLSVKRKYNRTVESLFWMLRGEEERFRDVPVHPYLRMFNLTTHGFAWCHVYDVEPYVYDTTLASKIVLPEDHRDLIEVLVEDLPTMSGDVVEGKSGGTCVLCVGKAGLGKTLTAEIYSEHSQKALYRVHSGQLGTEPADVEVALKKIFERAERWGCILLIDEADVYIRRRGDDLHHNAVVACFLRTMEYFGGILFMTTNRDGDVDDAIASRCVALIRYTMPSSEAVGQIFRIQSKALGANLSEEEVEKLQALYGGKVAGRDVKEMMKLATKYASSRKVPVTADVIRRLAQFKGF